MSAICIDMSVIADPYEAKVDGNWVNEVMIRCTH